MTRPTSTTDTAPDTPAPDWDEYRHGLDGLALDAVRDLLVDARCAYRDARRFPNSAAELVPYGDRCRAMARAMRNGAPYRLDRYGFPYLLDGTPGA